MKAMMLVVSVLAAGVALADPPVDQAALDAAYAKMKARQAAAATQPVTTRPLFHVATHPAAAQREQPEAYQPPEPRTDVSDEIAAMLMAGEAQRLNEIKFRKNLAETTFANDPEEAAQSRAKVDSLVKAKGRYFSYIKMGDDHGIGQRGRIRLKGEVVQIVSSTEMLIQLPGYAGIVKSLTVWATGWDTSKFITGDKVDVWGMANIPGTKTYESVGGGTRTVVQIELIPPPEKLPDDLKDAWQGVDP